MVGCSTTLKETLTWKIILGIDLIVRKTNEAAFKA